jgi:hypothetical protein
LTAHSNDGSVVTGSSQFDQIGIGVDEEIESDKQSTAFVEMGFALYYLCSASCADRGDCIRPLGYAMEKHDKLIPIGSPNPLAVTCLNKPFGFDIMELN